MDLTVFRNKLAATTESLADAGREAEGDKPSRMDAALEQLQRTARGLEELVLLVRADPLMSRDCPSCRKKVMTAATVCGYCWIKLLPVSS